MTAMPAPVPGQPVQPADPVRRPAARPARPRRHRSHAGRRRAGDASGARRRGSRWSRRSSASRCSPARTHARRSTRWRLAAIPVTTTTETAFAKLAFGDRAEGLVAVVRSPVRGLDDLALPEDPLLVVIEGVEKPGNLGAVLRSADGAGADALIAASPRTDLANPNAIRASAGTIFAVPIAAAPDARRPRLAPRARHPDRRDAGRRRADVHRRRPDRAARPRPSAARRTA